MPGLFDLQDEKPAKVKRMYWNMPGGNPRSLFDMNRPEDLDTHFTLNLLAEEANKDFMQSPETANTSLINLLQQIKNPYQFEQIRKQMSQHKLRSMENPNNTFPPPENYREFEGVNRFLKSLMGE